MWKITKLEFNKREFPRIFKMILNAVSLILKILEKTVKNKILNTF